jgi:hypothetical protein
MSINMKSYPYLFSYACFTCRKAFKQARRNLITIETNHRTWLHEAAVHTCPQCSGKLWNMGRKFKPPRKDDETAWEKVYEWRTQARDVVTKGSQLLHRIEEDARIRTRR